jgi:exopolysaccharide biosynthesis polyprenyl glycosylphosphotransferase
MSWNWSEVPPPSPHPTQRPLGIEWAARLIPGAASACQGGKKARRGSGIRIFTEETSTSLSDYGAKWGARAPTPVRPGKRQDTSGEHWLLAGLRDYALVVLNWILVAQIFLQLHVVLLRVPVSSGVFFRWHDSQTFVGIALLHGVLIHLLSRSDAAHLADSDLREQVRMLGRAVFWGTAVLSATLQLQGFSTSAAAAVWGAGLLHFGTLWGCRWAERNGYQSSLQVTRGTRNVLIVGAGAAGRRIAKHVSEHPEVDRAICGFLDDRKPLGNGVVGRTCDLMELARMGFVDEVILAPPQDAEVTQRVLRTARQLRLDVKMAPQLFGCEPEGKLESLGNIPLISLHEEKLPVGGLLLKRTLDVAAAGTALVFLTPALALIAMAIKIGSSGPVLYKAARAGRKGRPFLCYKFRTMVKNADDLKDGLRERNQRLGPFFKIKGDPRITGIGRFLRRYSLDELPQLWNVVRGEMSMVGPRPHPLDDVSAYAIEHLSRLDVLPGITGLWQVTARQDPSFQTGMKLDIEYIHRWSLRMDLAILLRTAGAVLRGSGE